MSKRIAKNSLKLKEDELTWTNTLVDVTVGDPVHGEDSVSGRIRRLYTTSYKSLDQFDQLWYECCYDKRDSQWQTCYIWAIILDCVINARAAYCELHSCTEPMKDFAHKLVDELKDYIANMV